MPRITSTSFITGTGFMKCMPMTLSARFVVPAISVMGMELVLDARMASALHFSSNSLKIFFLRSRSSKTASTTRSASSCVIFSFLTMRSRFFLMVASAFSRKSSDCSMSVTSKPDWAKTCAMPLPIVPPPTTATFFIAMLPPLRCGSYYQSVMLIATAPPPPRQAVARPRLPPRSLSA